MIGWLTINRYPYATVFVDQASKLDYIYLQKITTVEETLEVKRVFQQYSLEKGVTIKVYHADNGIFRENEWQQQCKQENNFWYL